MDRSIIKTVIENIEHHKIVIEASQNRHKASCIKSKPPNCTKCPKKYKKLWALDTGSTGNQCPSLVLPMPVTWSLSAHLMSTDRPLNGL